jgi:hypothetical protein
MARDKGPPPRRHQAATVPMTERWPCLLEASLRGVKEANPKRRATSSVWRAT